MMNSQIPVAQTENQPNSIDFLAIRVARFTAFHFPALLACWSHQLGWSGRAHRHQLSGSQVSAWRASGCCPRKRWGNCNAKVRGRASWIGWIWRWLVDSLGLTGCDNLISWSRAKQCEESGKCFFDFVCSFCSSSGVESGQQCLRVFLGDITTSSHDSSNPNSLAIPDGQ